MHFPLNSKRRGKGEEAFKDKYWEGMNTVNIPERVERVSHIRYNTMHNEHRTKMGGDFVHRY